MNSKLLLITSFVCGSVIMILELLGFRIFAPYFGYSIYVWGSLIGVVMIALSLGYFLGGTFADKKPEISLLYYLIFFADLYLLVIIFFYKIILSHFVGLGVIYGSIVSSLVIFVIPMLLLSMVSPFLIKILSQSKNVGFTAGKIYGISTFGSIFGVFFSTFFLIPEYGTRMTLNFCFISLLIVVIVGLFLKSKKFVFLFCLSFFLLINTVIPTSDSTEVIFEKESIYNLVKIIKHENTLYLALNNNKYTHSMYNPSNIFTGQVFDVYLAGPILSNPKDALILGLGAGTSLSQLKAFFPNTTVDAVEIDPIIIDVGLEKFGIKNLTGVNIYAEDARPFIMNSKKNYDFIELDVYQGGPYAPFYVLTKEFFDSLYKHTNPDGIFLMNVLDLSDEGIIVNPIANTLSYVYPSVYKIRFGPNYVLIATKKVTLLSDIQSKLSVNNYIDFNGLFDSLVYVYPSNEYVVLTDDLAPIEKLTYNMLKKSEK